MPQFTMILVRHGHVEGIKPEKFRGQIDLPLTEKGRRQASVTADYLDSIVSFEAVYSSPLSRCMDTARSVGAKRQLEPTALSELIDVNYGAWQGRERMAVAREETSLYQRWMSRPDMTVIPHAESLQLVQIRLVKALQLFRERHDNQTIVVVGHDSSNRVLLLTALDMPLSRYWSLRQDPCGVNVITFEGNSCTVDRINETAHLASIASP